MGGVQPSKPSGPRARKALLHEGGLGSPGDRGALSVLTRSAGLLSLSAHHRWAAGSPDCLAAPLDLGYAWGPPGVSPLDSGRAGSRISGHDCPSRGAGLSCCRSHTPVTAQPGPGTVCVLRSRQRGPRCWLSRVPFSRAPALGRVSRGDGHREGRDLAPGRFWPRGSRAHVICMSRSSAFPSGRP